MLKEVIRLSYLYSYILFDHQEFIISPSISLSIPESDFYSNMIDLEYLWLTIIIFPHYQLLMVDYYLPCNLYSFTEDSSSDKIFILTTNPSPQRGRWWPTVLPLTWSSTASTEGILRTVSVFCKGLWKVKPCLHFTFSRYWPVITDQ